MQFIVGTMSFQNNILLSILVVQATNALQCNICLDRPSCEAQLIQQECNADIVSLHHRILNHINPSLSTAVPSPNFKCYDLHLLYPSPLTGSSVLVVQKGCTYNETAFCEGWNSTSTMYHCGTCNSDLCNRYTSQNETTTTSAPVTTSTIVTTSTASVNTPTANPNVTTTTTVATTSTTTGSGSSTPVTGNTTSTTAKPGSAGCAVVSWMLVGGFTLLHGVVTRF